MASNLHPNFTRYEEVVETILIGGSAHQAVGLDIGSGEIGEGPEVVKSKFLSAWTTLESHVFVPRDSLTSVIREGSVVILKFNRLMIHLLQFNEVAANHDSGENRDYLLPLESRAPA